MDDNSAALPIRVRTYGSAGPFVVLLHGGPGAPGYMAPVARQLADTFQVLEPFQRGSGDKPLTVARHVADLDEVVKSHCGGSRPAVIGHSWGAMLALACAAAHPDSVGSLVLIGCGTFDPVARERLRTTRRERMGENLLRREARLCQEYPDANERLKAMGRLYQLIDSFDLISHEDETATCDARAHEETWSDMLRLQDEGVFPASFAAIDVPVLMLHGAEDPHPGRMIRAGLEPHLPQLEYHEWERCGHYPWLEKWAHESFYGVLNRWLSLHSA
jgi:pimeloyl-ACP methyl ester carboxylesterase